MSLVLFFGLVLQFVAILLVMRRVRQQKLAYTGVLFVWVSGIYHGLTELMQSIYPGMNHYRTMVSQDDIDSWVLIYGLAILTFAVTYCYLVRPHYKQKIDALPGSALGLVNWRWGIAIVILLYIVRGGFLGRFEDLGYWGGLIGHILPIFTVLVFVEYFYKMNGRHILPIFFFLVGMGVLSGQRSSILFDMLVLFCVLTRYGIPIRWKQVFLPGIIAFVLMVSISGMRSVVGRVVFYNQTNLERVESLLAGVKIVFQYGLPLEVLGDIVYRFDGNSFGGFILAGYREGAEPAGWAPIFNNFRLVVPSFMNPTKLEGGLFKLSEKDYLVDYFKMCDFWIDGLTGDLHSVIDFISGMWGILFGAFGTVGVLLSAAVMGCAFAMVDNWIMRSKTLLAVLIGCGVTSAVVWMEQGVRTYFLTGRAVFALFLVFVIFRQVRRILVGSCRRISTVSSELSGQVERLRVPLLK